MTVVKWAWVYGSLSPTLHATVEEAAEMAWFAANREEESFYCCEVIDANGSRIVLGSDPEFADVQDRLAAEEEAEYRAQPHPTLRLRVRGPDDDDRQWGTIRATADEDEAWREYDEWVALLGSDRVRMEPFDPPMGRVAIDPRETSR